MIIGIGSDLIDIRRVEKSLERFGERFTQRCFTEIERAKSDGRKNRAASYAKRFAAKEALVKALGTGFRFGVGPRDIGVRHDPLGRPYLVFSAVAQGLLDARGVAESHLSLADEEDLAVAFVTLLRQPRSTSP